MKSPEQVGKYRIDRRIGAGGMGTVYLAHDPRINRQVALKFLRVDNHEARRRFEIEAQSAGRLKHPNIVTIFDYDELDETPFIVMEFVEGHTLQETIRQGTTMSAKKRVGLIRQVLGGLHYAHTAGVIHRDIKPSNLIITHDGSIKILDFGIARNNDTHATHSSRIVGTAAYMAPEQIRVDPIDRRCDLFSVGAVLQEFLTGQQAFEGETDYLVMDRILREDPAPFNSPDELLNELMRPVIARALAKSPADRFSDAEAFSLALGDVLGQLQGTADSERVIVTPVAAQLLADPRRDETVDAPAVGFIASAPEIAIAAPPAEPAVTVAEPPPIEQAIAVIAAAPVASSETLSLPAQTALLRTARPSPTKASGASASLPHSIEVRSFLSRSSPQVPSTIRSLLGTSASLHAIAAAGIIVVAIANAALPATREMTRMVFLAPSIPLPPPPAPPEVARESRPTAPTPRPQTPIDALPEPAKVVLETSPPVEAPAAVVEEKQPIAEPIPISSSAPLADTTPKSDLFGADPVDKVDRAAQLLEDAVPEFPADALRNKVQYAEVTVEVIVARDGAVLNPRIVRGADLFNEAAMEAALKYKFRAARLRGQAVASRVLVQIKFFLR